MNNGGWDVVYGCSENLLNQRLESEKEQFTLRINREISGIKVQADITEWKIVKGGAANYIVFEITSSGMIADISFKDLKSTARIALTFTKTNETTGKLVLGTENGSVEILDIDHAGIFHNQPDMRLALDILRDVYTEVITENNQRIDFIFAEVTNINTAGIGLKKFKYTWYQPYDNKLAGFLMILGVLEEEDISKLPLIVDDKLLFDASGEPFNAVFLLSAEKIMTKYMLNAMPEFFRGSKTENYKFSEGKIVNDGNIPLASVEVGAVTYDPYMSSFRFYFSDDKAVTILNGRCPIKGLTDAYIDFSLTSKNKLSYIVEHEALFFEKDPNFTVTANKDIPSWEEWIGILSLGILNLVTECVSAALEDAVVSKLSSYSLNARELGCHAVNWGKDLNVTDGGFSDNLYIQSC